MPTRQMLAFFFDQNVINSDWHNFCLVEENFKNTYKYKFYNYGFKH
jgi:hypothetical protein